MFPKKNPIHISVSIFEKKTKKNWSVMCDWNIVHVVAKLEIEDPAASKKHSG